MAKLTPVVLDENPRYDGLWNVKIRIGHKSKSVYLETEFFIAKNQLNKDGGIKSDYVVSNLSELLNRYNSYLKGLLLEEFTAAEIKQKLIDFDKPKTAEDDVVDFIVFSRRYTQSLIDKGKKSTADTFRTVINSLDDYMKGEVLNANSITSKFLQRYESYLRSPRLLKRMNQGKLVEYQKDGLKDRGIHNHMRDFRILFNQAKDFYNDEEIGLIRIPNNPYKKYKVVDAPETEDRDLTVEEIIKIRECKIITLKEDMAIRNAAMSGRKDWVFDPDYIVVGSMGELARDLGLLSFYLCGMNAADLYELLATKGDRIEYKRKKTRGRRKDEAFISIKIPEVARELYDKYAGSLQKRYVDLGSLNGVLKKGMDRLSLATGIDKLQLIRFRHAFASLARNECRFSKDDVALAMNHKDNSNKTTDIYIRKDWSIIDEVQEKTIGLLLA